MWYKTANEVLSIQSLPEVKAASVPHLHKVYSLSIERQQRRILSDWAVQSGISLVNPLKSCQFIRIARRRLISASFVTHRRLVFLFQVSCLFMQSWHGLSVNCCFCEYFDYYLFHMEESQTQRKSKLKENRREWSTKVQNLVSKKNSIRCHET